MSTIKYIRQLCLEYEGCFNCGVFCLLYTVFTSFVRLQSNLVANRCSKSFNHPSNAHMLRRIGFLLAFVFSISPWLATAQSTISGNVVDAAMNVALDNVHIVIESHQSGVITNADGAFQVTVSNLPVRLIFSRIGYSTLQMTVNSAKDPLKVVLQPTALDMDPIIVSASRELQPRTESAVSISAIGTEQLARTNPDMIFQVFNQVAGVHMVDLGNDQYKLSIRQPFTNKAYFLFMEDGIALRPIGIFNPNGLLEANMHGLDRIEILRGPSSAVYGGNAVAGSINTISKNPFLAAPVEFGLRRDSYGYLRSDVSGSFKKNNVGVSFSGFGAKQRDSWYEHSDYDRLAFSSRVDVKLSDKSLWQNTISYSNLNSDTNGALDSLNFIKRGFTSQHTFSYRELASLRVRSTLIHQWNDHSSSNLTLYGRNNRLDQLPYWKVRSVRGKPTKATGEIQKQSFWSLGAIGHQEWRLTKPQVTILSGFSADYSPSTYSSNWIDVTKDSDGKYASYVSPDSLLSDYAADILNIAGFVEASKRFTEAIKVSGSLRFDHVQYQYDNFLTPSAFSGAPDETTSYQHVSPRIGITVDLKRGKGAYANMSWGFAPPEVNELYNGVKTPSLKPATFSSMEVGGWAALLHGKAFVDVSLYSMKGFGEIIPIVAPNGSFVNENAGETAHYGLEYTALIQPDREWSLRVSGSNSIHRFVEFNDYGVDRADNDMAFSPKWMGNMELAYTPSFLRGVRVSTEWNHMGKYFMDNSNEAAYSGYDVFNARLSFEHGNITVWGNVLNVFDTLYASNAAWYTWGSTYNVGQVRTATVGVKVRL